MKNTLESKGAELLIVIIPMDVQVDQKYWDKYPTKVFGEKEFTNDLPQKKFQEICTRNGLSCLDLLPIFREHRQEQLLQNWTRTLMLRETSWQPKVFLLSSEPFLRISQ